MILVTGGTGLVGSHLLYQLTLEDNAVKAIFRTDASLAAVKKVFSYFTDDVEQQFSKINWIKADITDVPSLTNAFKDITIVYHAAALVSFDKKEYRKMRKINIEGTANIVNFSIDNHVKKLCFVSSIAAVGNAINNETITEENEWNVEDDNNGYAVTKYGAEMEVWRASQEGVDVVIVNPGVILGAGFWTHGTGEMFTKIHKGFKYYTEGETGFVGVTDVAKAMVELVNSEIKNKRFILVSENKSFKEIFTLIATNLGKKPPSIKVSKSITAVLWRLDLCVSLLTGRGRKLTRRSSKSLHNITSYDSEKIKKQLLFEFSPIEKVIKQTCSFYKKS